MSTKPAAAIPREVELKYLVLDEPALRQWLAGDRLQALGAAAISDVSSVEVEDLYVDTARGALARAGFGARVRREGSGPFVLTVKSASHERPGSAPQGDRKGLSRALSQRMEVEGPAGERLDPDAWPPSAAQSLVNEVRRGARLRPLFTIAQERERRILELEAGPIELTLDRVAVLRDGSSVGTFTVLEAEAAPGASEGLAALAELLEATGYVTPEPRSKEEMARPLVEGVAPVPREPPPVPRSPGVTVDDPLAEAGRKVLRMHLARMLAHEAGTRSGEDPQHLHRMRVATRRMRAAWRVFEDAYRPRVVRRYVRELQAVAQALGEVRDLDVLLEGLDGYVGTLPESGSDAMAPLGQAWRDAREDARRRLLGLLDAGTYQAFVDDYLAFTRTPGAGTRPSVGAPGRPILVRDTAGSRILAAYEHVRTYETVMGWADVPTLHGLRIAGKRLRYTLEYFAEVLPVPARGLIATVTDMQDQLGLMNDAHVAATITRDWLNGHAHELAGTSREAVGLYLDSREAAAQRHRHAFRPLWRRVTGRAFRRTLGAVVTQIG